AMAFLLDPKADAGLLKSEAAKTAPLPKAQAGALQDFVRALQHYRSGQIISAKQMAAHQGVDKIFARAPGMVDQKAFLQKCTDATCPTCRLTKGKSACAMCGGKG